MKALTVSQPYASLIASGRKWVENRCWSTPYRGPIAIHAGKGTQYLSRHDLRRYPTGCIVATSNLIACILLPERGKPPAQPWELRQLAAATGITLEMILAHEYTEGPVAWILRGVRRYREPIPCAGKQGLWDWEEPDLVEIVGANE